MRTPSRRFTIIAALTALLVAIPVAAVATHYFSDVADDSTHAPGIEYVAETGITTGCEDGTKFCPGQTLRRDQMATFLYRASGWDEETPPSVNAWNTTLVNFQLMFTTFEDFTLVGGQTHECVAAEPFGGPMEFVQVSHALTSAPSTQNALVNVALNIDRENTNGEYDVCFARIDGQPLEAGEYETSVAASVDLFGGLAFDTASADTDEPRLDEDTARAMMAAKLGR